MSCAEGFPCEDSEETAAALKGSRLSGRGGRAEAASPSEAVEMIQMQFRMAGERGTDAGGRRGSWPVSLEQNQEEQATRDKWEVMLKIKGRR